MSRISKGFAAITPLFALAAGGAAGGAEPPRALALNVIESDGSVEVELVANSPVTQQVQYEIELVGTSRARHRGDTSVPAGNRQVLSRFKTSVADSWCATVDVTEASGASYTLTAGDCSQD